MLSNEEKKLRVLPQLKTCEFYNELTIQADYLLPFDHNATAG